MPAGVLIMAAVTLMMVSAMVIGRFSLIAAEHDRIAERSRLLEQVIATATNYGPDQVTSAVLTTPFARNAPELNQRLILQFGTTPSGDTLALAALVAPDGTVLASTHPERAPPATADLGSSWTDALAGEATWSPSLRFAGQAAWAIVAPVGGSQPWANLVLVQQNADSTAQNFASRLGTLGTGKNGGLSLVGQDGRVLVGWDARTLGTQIDDPATLERLPVGRTVVQSDRDVTTLYRKLPSGQTGMFRQPTSELFADLRAQQLQRDLTLLAVLAAAIVLLSVGSMIRVRAVRQHQARLHALLSNSQDLILVFGPDDRVRYASPVVAELLGRDDDTCTGLPLDKLAHPADRDRISQLIKDPGGSLLDVRLGPAGGDYRWFDLEASRFDIDRQLRGILLTCHEASERKTLQDKLADQARHDSLTGLPNRLMLVRTLNTVLGQPQSGPARPALLFIDLDRFKQVNDQHGHECGDQVLHAIADRMRALVGDSGLVCRFGGDEFGVLLHRVDETTASKTADRLVAVASQPIEIMPSGTDPVWVQVGASIGAALASLGQNDPEDLLRAADMAMYRAKNQGRGQVVIAPATGHSAAAAVQLDSVAPPAPAASTLHEAGRSPVTLGTKDGDPQLAPLPRPIRAHSGPAPASRSARRGRLRQTWSWIRSAAALLAACTVLIAVAGVGMWQGHQARQAVEQQRLAERLEVTTRVAEYARSVTNLERWIPPINAAPWSLDGSIMDSLVIDAVLDSDVGGEGAAAALMRADGKVLAASGTELPPGISIGSGPWRQAILGKIGYVPFVNYQGEAYCVTAVPIYRDSSVAAILMIAQVLRNTPSERMLEALGSLGFGDGGVSSADLRGNVTHSWNPGLIGSNLAPQADLRSVPEGSASVIAGPAGMVTLASKVPSTQADQKVILFQQPADVFYGDLRSGQRARDLALVAMVIIVMALLVMVRWQRERVIRRAGERLDALLRHSHDIVLVTVQDRTTFASSAIQGLLGHDPQVVQPFGSLVHPQDQSRVTRYLNRPDGTLHNIRLERADGRFRWFDLRAVDLREVPSVGGVVITCHEVGERKALEDELSFRASHDMLTGLPNRSKFSQRLQELAEGSDDEEASGFTVLFIDLDLFKPVNDTFGHDAGDTVLCAVAHRLKEAAAQHLDAMVCRLGGDEFAVLVPGVSAAGASRLATTILQRVRQPITISGGTNQGGTNQGGTNQGLTNQGGASQVVRIGATIGIASSEGSATPETVVKNADEAMYQAKEAGRGRYAVYSG